MDFSARRTAAPFQSALSAFPGKRLAVAESSSSYFTAPTTSLDPALFGYGEKMRLSIRNWLRTTVHDFLTSKGFNDVQSWLRVWVAGSGVSYQWSAARDPGDLDVLLGVDYTRFRQSNLTYVGLSDKEISDDLNEVMSDDLWKRTADQRLGDSHYEVTWYVNPGSTDIRDINPYAAYDVDHAEWTVRPIDLPAAGPGEWFPQEWADAAERDRQRAAEIVTAYNAAAETASAATGPAWANAAAMLTAHARAAVELFDEIHKGRHEAFANGGQGYRDFANYRWQRGKLLGTIPALRSIKDATKEAKKDAETRLYGRELKSTEHVLIEAALGRQQ